MTGPDDDWEEQMGDIEYDPDVHEAGWGDGDVWPDDGTVLGELMEPDRYEP